MFFQGPVTFSKPSADDLHVSFRDWPSALRSSQESTQVGLRLTMVVRGSHDGCFQKIGVPQNGWRKSWKTLLKWMIWGGKHPYFWKHPYLPGVDTKMWALLGSQGANSDSVSIK